MRIPSHLQLKAGVLFGLLAVNLAAPLNHDNRVSRKDLGLFARLFDVVEPVPEVDPAAGAGAEGAGAAAAGGKGGATTSGESDVHLGGSTTETAPTTNGGAADTHLGETALCARGGGSCAAPAKVGLIDQTKGGQLFTDAQNAVKAPKPANEVTLRQKFDQQSTAYKAPEVTDSSPLQDPLDKAALSANTQAWFKTNLGLDMSSAGTPKKVAVLAKNADEGNAVFQGYVYGEQGDFIVTRTFRTFEEGDFVEQLYYPNGLPAAADRIQMSEFIFQEFSDIAPKTPIKSYTVGSIENQDAKDLIKSIVQRYSADPTKAPTEGDAVITPANTGDWNLIMASSAGKSFIRSITDHAGSPMFGTALPQKAFVRFGPQAGDFWIGFTM